MTMIQLNPKIWVMTPLGEGMAFLVVDSGSANQKILSVILKSGSIMDFQMKDCTGFYGSKYETSR